MADPNTFKTIITAEDDSAAGWSSFNARSRKAQQGVVSDANRARKQTTASWAKLKDGIGRATTPARLLSPELDRMFGTMEKLGKVTRSVQGVFMRPTGSASAAGRLSMDEVKAAGRQAMAGGRISFQPPRLRLGVAGEAGAAEGAVGEVGGLAGAASEVGTAAEGAVVGLGAVTAGLGAVVLGAGAAAVGLEIVAAKFSSKFARTAQEVQNTALASGVDAQTLQRWRGAAERNGLGQGAADSALGGLGMTLHNLQYGQGDRTTRNLLEQSGVRVGAPGEKVDLDAALQAISQRAQGMEGFTRANYLRSLGLESLAPLLARGPEKMTSDLAAVDKTGVVMSDASLGKGEGQAERLTNFEQSTRGLGYRAGETATDLSAAGIDAGAATVQGVRTSGDAIRRALGGVPDVVTRVLGTAPGGLAHSASDASAALRTLPAAVTAIRQAAETGQGRRAWGPALTPQVNAYIEKAAAQYHESPEELRRVAYQESGFRTQVKAGTSSAAGLFQFTKGTWLDSLKKHGAEVGYGREAAEIDTGKDGKPYVSDPVTLTRLLGLRGDGQLNAFMGAAYRSDNAEAFRKRFGRDPTPGEQYGSHMLGIGGEATLVHAGAANSGESAADVLPAAAASNHSTFYRHGRPLTVGDLEAHFDAIAAREPSPPKEPQAIQVTIITKGEAVQVVASSRNGPPPKVHQTRGPSGGE